MSAGGIKNGNYWSPLIGKFSVRDGYMYRENGEVSQSMLLINLCPYIDDETHEDFSLWSDEYRRGVMRGFKDREASITKSKKVFNLRGGTFVKFHEKDRYGDPDDTKIYKVLRDIVITVEKTRGGDSLDEMIEILEMDGSIEPIHTVNIDCEYGDTFDSQTL